MKIIRRGSPKTKKCKVECDKCGSMIEFTETDLVRHLVTDQRDGDYYDTWCPVCKDRMTIAASLMK
jgi:hypothetical protein